MEVLSTDEYIKSEVYDWTTFDDPDVLRQAYLYGYRYPDEAYDLSYPITVKMDRIRSKMVSILANQTVCNYTDQHQCDIPIKPVIRNIFETSDDPEELKYYWLAHQDKVSKAIKPLYAEFVALGNENAKCFNYSNKAERWMYGYERPAADEFEQVIINLYNQFEPFYKQIHAFVRKRLYKHYGPCAMDEKGPIPIHLTGSINAEDFSNIIDKIKPYPNKDSTDVTPQIVKQNYTVRKLAKICDDFYQSLGLPPMPQTFWENSLFEKPTDRNATCFWAAWDMKDKEDYRFLVCAKPSMNDLLGMCHETGHLQYAMGYKDQICCYRDASSLLNEALADVGGLSIVTIERLGKLGLLENPTSVDHEEEINQLFLRAMDKIAFLPYSMIVDIWRWKYFRGEINEHNANKAWWDLRLQYQGLMPPEPRPDDGLDPASKSHVVDDAQYIVYFFASVIQFQIQESLCKSAGKFNPDDPSSPPLSKCDLYGSKEAGQLLKNMFSVGLSKPWPYALKEVTGHIDIDATPILNYFKVLHDWLIEDNKKTGEVIGW